MLPAMKRVLDRYEKQGEHFACIRYDDYLAYVSTGPEVDRPDTWVIGLLGKGGGYLIPQPLHKRYLNVFFLGMSLAFVVVIGCLG
jgi:hypothetical protein